MEVFLPELEAIKEEPKRIHSRVRDFVFNHELRYYGDIYDFMRRYYTNVVFSEKEEPQDLIRTCLASEDLAVRSELNVYIFLLRRNLQRASCVIDICLP